MSGVLGNRRWNVLDADPVAVERIARECSVPDLVARVLVARGVTDPAEAREFLSPSLERDWADPLDIPGMGEAADRVQLALERGERMAVFGDFDVDGMSSTCLLTLALRRLGGDVSPFIPRRFGEGYGLSREALMRVIGTCDPSLVITVDNGISAGKEVAWLLGRGVDVVVTDHHEPSEDVPQGIPVTDPKLLDDCVSRELAGAGVALKLVCELGRRLGMPDLWREYTGIAALGTISDMMLLKGENRALVADGIAHMREAARPGVVALAATSGIDLAEATADSLPFSIIPRLNATGRMGTADLGFDLLFTDDPAEAAILAGRIEEVNNERREIETQLTTEALAVAESTYDGGRAIVVGGEGWHEGVKGIVASRLVNRYRKPSILFTISDGIARGSGRSVGQVDLFHAVEQCSDLLIRFGGHSGAVGVTLDAANLDAFRDRLEDVLGELDEEMFQTKGEVTAIVGLDELSLEAIASLDMLQPFGQGNKKPLLAVRGVTMRSRARVGNTADHLRFVATDGIHSIPAIMFRVPHIDDLVDYEGVVDLVFEAVNESWQGRTKPKLMVRDIIKRLPEAPDPSEQSLVDELFSRSAEILSRGEYAGIAEASTFKTKVVGVSFEGRQDVVRLLAEGDALGLVREPDNPADEWAIAVKTRSGDKVGYLRRQISTAIAPLMDDGASYEACVLQVTGGDEGHSLGVNMQVSRVDVAGNAKELGERALRARDLRTELSRLDSTALTERLRERMIGPHPLLPAQALALEKLASGSSTLCVMATGRGKSLIFHIHAAREAIARGRASVFVYPLRALVADQAFHLTEAFEPLGMSVRVLTGETPLDERDEVFSSLASGAVDILLTTPEFLAIHSARFAESGRVGFVVIDEAHHAGMAKSGHRSAYNSMSEVLLELGGPTVLAVTATAASPVASSVCELLGIDEQDVVVDESVRSNLTLVDSRELRDRETALVGIVARGQKCVVYVNSREQSVSIARSLRKCIPELGQRIAFYNAGLSRADRTRVEQAFRDGELTCIVSTSAFGEGVNLPDIRHVMLYHMPFGDIEFNQMSGRAGRDGKPAQVHLLFGARDARINERIIRSQAPERSDLVGLYRQLKAISRSTLEETGETSFSIANADIAEAVRLGDAQSNLDERSVSCGIAIFRELGFLKLSGYGSARRIEMVASPERMELSNSIRYLEGLRLRDEFERFRDWALTSTADDMLARINRPITPDFGQRVS